MNKPTFFQESPDFSLVLGSPLYQVFGRTFFSDDAAREWAYDRQLSIGRLFKGLDEAQAKGWTVVNMKDDWNRI
jgi:hypothetical protein